MAAEYYYSRDGQRLGPVSGVQLRELAQKGELRPNDLIWSPEKNQWIRAGEIKALFPAATPAAPAAAPQAAVTPTRPAATATPARAAVGKPAFPWVLVGGLGAGGLVMMSLMTCMAGCLMWPSSRTNENGTTDQVAKVKEKESRNVEAKDTSVETGKEKSTTDAGTTKGPPAVEPKDTPKIDPTEKKTETTTEKKTETPPEKKTPPKTEPNPAVETQLKRGNEAIARRDFDTAIAAYSEAIRLEPTSAQAYCYRGQARMNQGAFAQAIADCNKALDLAPMLIDAYIFRSASEFDGNNHAAAIETATRALKIAPKVPFFYFVRGYAHVKLGEPARGLDDLDEAIRLDSKNAAYFGSRGEAHAKLGNREKANADFARRDALQSGGMSAAKQRARQQMLQAEAIYKRAAAMYEADYRRYESMRNTYQAQAGRARAMGITLRPPMPPDPRLEQQMRQAQAAYQRAKQNFESTR